MHPKPSQAHTDQRIPSIGWSPQTLKEIGGLAAAPAAHVRYGGSPLNYDILISKGQTSRLDEPRIKVRQNAPRSPTTEAQHTTADDRYDPTGISVAERVFSTKTPLTSREPSADRPGHGTLRTGNRDAARNGANRHKQAGLRPAD